MTCVRVSVKLARYSLVFDIDGVTRTPPRYHGMGECGLRVGYGYGCYHYVS